MAEKEQQSASDVEAPTIEQHRKSRRIKCLIHIFLFAAFQTGIILLFAFTVMKIKTPKFRIESASLSNITSTNTSLSLTMNADLLLKNSNFGRFKFQATPLYFYYRGLQVAELVVAKGRVNWKSTNKIDELVNVSVANSAELQRDLVVGVVSLSSRATMRGSVRVAMAFERRRSVNMNCTMEIATGAQQLRNIVCQ